MTDKQVALIVGASRGIGRQVAVDLAKYVRSQNTSSLVTILTSCVGMAMLVRCPENGRKRTLLKVKKW